MTPSGDAGAARGPFAGVRQLLIDGNNLLHRTAGAAGEGQVRLLLASLRAVVPPAVATIVVLDGHPAPGESRRMPVARNLEIRRSGSRSADDALIEIVLVDSPWERASTTLVSDDRALVERARTLGARTQRLAWLDALLTRPTHAPRALEPRIDAGRPARSLDEEREREPWKPGRGATRKRGNPRRQPRGRNRPE